MPGQWPPVWAPLGGVVALVAPELVELVVPVEPVVVPVEPVVAALAIAAPPPASNPVVASTAIVAFMGLIGSSPLWMCPNS
jgi:hypothetical protein